MCLQNDNLFGRIVRKNEVYTLVISTIGSGTFQRLVFVETKKVYRKPSRESPISCDLTTFS